MFKAIWLIFDSVGAWERIAESQRKVWWILFGNTLPLLLLGSAAEGYGLTRWGKPSGTLGHLKIFSVLEAERFEGFQIVLWLFVLLIVSVLTRSLLNTFHGNQNSFRSAFTVMAYGLSPFFLVRALNMFPISPWPVWGVGAFLAAMVLYQGMPRVAQPDPPNAFGFYVTSIVQLVIVVGLACLLSFWVIQGKIPLLQKLFSLMDRYHLF